MFEILGGLIGSVAMAALGYAAFWKPLRLAGYDGSPRGTQKADSIYEVLWRPSDDMRQRYVCAAATSDRRFVISQIMPNHALQRTRHDAVVGNRCVPRAGSLSLGR
jgi:hypothetical protein